jgi:predicted nucleic acid-binding protein
VGPFANAAMRVAVFIDASFWIALRANNQAEHPSAVALLKQMAAEKRAFISTHFVFAEVHAHFSRHQRLRQQVTHDFFKSPVFRIEHLEQVDYDEAIKLLQTHRDKDYSYCDALSFALMRRLGLENALSFDGHFEQIGEFNIIKQLNG